MKDLMFNLTLLMSIVSPTRRVKRLAEVIDETSLLLICGRFFGPSLSILSGCRSRVTGGGVLPRRFEMWIWQFGGRFLVPASWRVRVKPSELR